MGLACKGVDGLKLPSPDLPQPSLTGGGPEVAVKVKWWVFVLLCLMAAATVIQYGVDINHHWFVDKHVEQTARGFASGDVDDAVFIKDIGHHSGFFGPLFWWHNGWHGTAYPYYWRPLTLYGFWCEYHLFGAYRFDRWQVADIFFHAVFAVVLGLFAYRVSGSKFAAPLTVILFSKFYLFSIPYLTYYGLFFATPDGLVVLASWMDQPEAWGAICTLVSLMSTMGRRWWWALGWAVASVCFKESGWFTFPMLLATLLYTGDLRRVPRGVWIGTAVSWIVLIALRASAGHDVMFPPHEKGNFYGVERYLRHVVDPNLQQLTTDKAPIVLFAVICGWLVLSKRPRFVYRFLIALAAFGAAAVGIGIATQTDVASGFAILVDPNTGQPQFEVALLDTIVLLLAWRYPPARRQAAYLYSLVLLTDVGEIMVLQPNAHMQYFLTGMQSAMVVTMTLACLRTVRSMVRERMTRSKVSEPEVEAASTQ